MKLVADSQITSNGGVINLTETGMYSDDDCLPDSVETELGLNLNSPTSDTSDNDSDSDGDGISNCEELLQGYDPGNSDMDGDRLSDFDEELNDTDPFDQDSDDDGFLDGDEVGFNSNPLDSAGIPMLGFTTAGGLAFSARNTKLPEISYVLNEIAGPEYSFLNTSTGSLEIPTITEAVSPGYSFMNISTDSLVIPSFSETSGKSYSFQNNYNLNNLRSDDVILPMNKGGIMKGESLSQ